MTAPDLIRLVNNRPFEPFSIFIADGRKLRVPHPEMASTGRYGLSVRVIHDSGHVKIIDAALICSMRTLHPSSMAFDEDVPPEEREQEE